MKKITIALLLSLYVLVCQAYDFQVDGIYYVITSSTDKTAAVTYFDGYKYTGNVEIPVRVPYRKENFLITSISSRAFENCRGLTSVTIPNSVTSIKDYAFSGCKGLSSVSIPNSVTSIGNCAFSGCALLTSITIPNSVTSIGSCAFENCRGLTNITTFNSVTSIGMCAFSNTGWYNNQPDGILYLDKCCLGYKGEKPTGTLTLRDDTRLIAGGAFENCTGLTSVTIPNSVTRIGYDAFLNCYSLTSVEIPNSVTSIGNSAFANCRDLRSVTIGNSVKEIGHHAFFSTERIDVYCKPATPPSCKTDAFEYAREITLYIPIGCKSAYKSATCWENFEYIYETSF